MSLKSSKGPQTMNQDEHLDQALSKKVTGDVLCVGDVLGPDASAAGLLVEVDSLLRVRVTTLTYVAFGDSTIGAVTSSTSPAIELPVAGTYLINATDDYVRASAAFARLERIKP